MRNAIITLFLSMSIGIGAAQAQLKIDFTIIPGSAPGAAAKVQEGYQGYFAADKKGETFKAQSYQAFGTTVTIKPSWPEPPVAAAMRIIDRGPEKNMDPQDLLVDWIGTDTRVVFDPFTLTISGLPAGTYQWLSYHHDPNDQTGTFDLTIEDAAGSKTITGTDISNGPNFKLADVTKLTTTITSDGKDITLVFNQTSPSDVNNQAIFVMNGFELTAVK